MNLEKLKYPIGSFDCPSNITTEIQQAWFSILEHFPNRLINLVGDLSEAQLNTPYRPEGWTVRQVIHHLYDSHHNSYSRFKWTLTEETPLIKVYDEKAWGDLIDSKNAPIELSLNALTALHAKWVYLLKGLTEADFQKSFIHPEGNEYVTLAENIGIYAWHCNHHYAHIENLLKREGWK
ncbi:putative metal-dependent hydrolase [Aequorivita sp. F47161]|uniref:Metal-dependent hydrolase n=1 Tax=Aequorivita vitellina TaxID=2874475 RepID=A0A9X1QX15_9FLAO|nr:putative metal-dependent hydrolase [Aequorivita vitellina]MCG2419394.1 putative metal-dependent hydrolase [Aequorivita vitellina]MCZ4318572.1 putative metal-dependent hydrolase [Aequorivita viscosa]